MSVHPYIDQHICIYLTPSLSMYIYMYMYIMSYLYICICILHIYIYICMYIIIFGAGFVPPRPSFPGGSGCFAPLLPEPPTPR